MSATLRSGILPGSFVLSSPPGTKTVALSEVDIRQAVPQSPSSHHYKSMIDQTVLQKKPAGPVLNVAIDGAFHERSVGFLGFFKEGVIDSPTEVWRYRYLIVKFSLGDETLDIDDPETYENRNDGIIHGKFLRRTKVEGLNRTTFIHKLRVGQVLPVFGKGIYLYACDDITRDYFEELGYPQPPNEDPKLDAFTTTKIKWEKPAGAWHGTKTSTITRYLEASLGCQRKFQDDSKERYLKYDGIHFRFNLLWEHEDGGEVVREKFTLKYYLASEETVIYEDKDVKPASGPPATFLKRSRLPRTIMPHDDRLRSCEDVSPKEDYYNENDFIVGEYITVYGRRMLICDCDDTTQAWYLKERNFDQQAGRVVVTVPEVPKVERPIPPPTGFGSDEDTIRNLYTLIPTQPRKDFANRKNQAYRFKASLVTVDPIDRGRDFRITYYVDDKEVGIYEPAIRNSGIVGGSFLRRVRLTNPSTGKYYELEDFKEGGEITINAHSFSIYGTEKIFLPGMMPPSPTK